MAGDDKVKCENPDCRREAPKRDLKGAVGGSLLCPECWPMLHETHFKTDPVIDQTPRYKCRRYGCRTYKLSRELTAKGYCSQECELVDLQGPFAKYQ